MTLANKKWLSDRRLWVAGAALSMVAGFGAFVGLTADSERTDNAIVRCDITDVVSEEVGVIREIRFVDNGTVAAGDVLIVMDDASFAAARQHAAAGLETARSMLEIAVEERKLLEIDIDASILRAKAAADSAQARVNTIAHEREQIRAETVIATLKLNSEEANLARTRQLYSQNFLPQKHLDDAVRDHELASMVVQGLVAKNSSNESRAAVEQAGLRDAEAAYSQAKLSRSGKLSASDAAISARSKQIETAEAELAMADIRLSRTRIKARREGDVTNRRVAAGQHVDIGQPIASITSCASKAWIEANFKETQIERMSPGQTVVVKLDTYPGQALRGWVESLSNGSGSMFSVLPPENATGNFTKVVQRFPVKIRLDPTEGPTLRVGMSAVVSVDVGQAGQAPRLGHFAPQDASPGRERVSLDTKH